jgi:hypothetical protein
MQDANPTIDGRALASRFANDGALVLGQLFDAGEIERVRARLAHYALDPVSADNGPVRFWLGPHCHGLFEHVPNPPRMNMVGDPARVEALTCGVLLGVMRSGWATLHDGLVVHDSQANTLGAPRLAIAIEYRERRAGE